MTNSNNQLNWDFQTAIATLDRKVMEDILTTQLCRYGVSSDIARCRHKGVPLFLIRCKNGISYVCTLAQAQYFAYHLIAQGMQFTYTDDATAFRVFPDLVNTQHKDKGTQYGVHYVSFAKSREYNAPIVLPL